MLSQLLAGQRHRCGRRRNRFREYVDFTVLCRAAELIRNAGGPHGKALDPIPRIMGDNGDAMVDIGRR